MADSRRILTHINQDNCTPKVSHSHADTKSMESCLDRMIRIDHAQVGGASELIDVAPATTKTMATCHSEKDLQVFHEGKAGSKIRKIKSESCLKKKKSDGFGGSEDCDSDASSVCSEHSKTGRATGYKRMRKGWKKCPVHSKGPKHSKDKRAARRQRNNQLSVIPSSPPRLVIDPDDCKDNVEAKEDDDEEADKLCTCVIVTKVRPPRGSTKRPEPEGGQTASNFLDEYDRIIYGSEPLFSDTEENRDMDIQVQAEMFRYHKRQSRCGTDADIFATAMMVTSNTMMRFAIIQAELKNLVEGALRRAESEVGALTRRIRLLEEDYETTENRLTSATEKLEQASKAADESERGRKVLENRNINAEETLNQLEKELEETILLGEEADRKYEEAARKLAITEVDLERAEARLEAAEAKIQELEEELKVVGNNMKSLEISEQEASQREDGYEESIRDLTMRLKDAENRATEAERTVSKLQKEVDRLEEELLEEKMRYKALREEMDVCFQEIQSM